MPYRAAGAALVAGAHYKLVPLVLDAGYELQRPSGAAAIRFLAADDRFAVDRDRERRWVFSMHPEGYLKRVK